MDILLLTLFFASKAAPASSSNNTAVMLAARYGHSDGVKLLLEAGAAFGAKDNVSNRIYICTCVCVCECVCELYSSMIVYDKEKVLFYSILLFYYCDM